MRCLPSQLARGGRWWARNGARDSVGEAVAAAAPRSDAAIGAILKRAAGACQPFPELGAGRASVTQPASRAENTLRTLQRKDKRCGSRGELLAWSAGAWFAEEGGPFESSARRCGCGFGCDRAGQCPSCAPSRPCTGPRAKTSSSGCMLQMFAADASTRSPCTRSHCAKSILATTT